MTTCHLNITKQMCATTGRGQRYIFQVPLNANESELQKPAFKWFL